MIRREKEIPLLQYMILYSLLQYMIKIEKEIDSSETKY